MHPLAIVNPAIADEIKSCLSDRRHLTWNGSGAVADMIAAIPADRDIAVEIVSIETAEDHGSEQAADVVATIDGKTVVALMYIQDNGFHPIFRVRFAEEKPLRVQSHMLCQHASKMFEQGRDVAGAILGMVEFEYGSGVVRFGDGPLRHINSFNVVYDDMTGLLHLNDVVVNLKDTDLKEVRNRDDADDYDWNTRFLVDGVPLEFALDANGPDACLMFSIRSVDDLLERLESGESTGLRVVVDGVERLLTAEDIKIVRQPAIEDVIDADRSTLSEPVRQFLEELDELMERDPEFETEQVDEEEGSVLHADFGSIYAFDQYGSEGVLPISPSEPFAFEAMDFQGRMVSMQEISAQSAKLAA